MIAIVVLFDPIVFIASPIAFFFNDTATTQIYTLSLHDALPIYILDMAFQRAHPALFGDHHRARLAIEEAFVDRKSTRLNSSHMSISYAVFCLKKKTSYWARSGLCCASNRSCVHGRIISVACSLR